MAGSTSVFRGLGMSLLAGSTFAGGYLVAQSKNNEGKVNSEPASVTIDKDTLARLSEAVRPASKEEPWDKKLIQGNPYTPQKWNYNWDRRHPEMLVKPLRTSQRDDEKAVEARKKKLKDMTPKNVRKVILIRHGQYNLDGNTDEERYLTETGREQAALTGQRLKVLFERYKMGNKEGDNKNLKIRLFMSSMTRATETANIILDQLGRDNLERIESCDLIREGAPIVPEPPICKTLWNPDPDAFFTEGARIEAGFRKHIHRADPEPKPEPKSEEEKDANNNTDNPVTDETSALPTEEIDVLVCHGNVIRYFMCRSLQLPPDAWLRFGVHNGSISVLSMGPSGRASVRTYGEAGYMPKDKMTYN